MSRHRSELFTVGWLFLVIVGIAIVMFGVVVTILASSRNDAALGANGMASMGMGLFGLLITLIPFRRAEGWAWGALWYYPVFWIVHLVFRLPPGKDHIHQIVFIFMSVTGLLFSLRELFPRHKSASSASR